MLIEITFFLAAAIFLVPLGKRLGIPTVLGYLLTGIIVGPSVLNVANDPAHVMKLAEYGIIMLMFLLGLELRPQRLWQMRHGIFRFGAWQLGLTSLVLLILLWLLLPISFIASIVVASALALSSTTFMLQFLSRKQQLKTHYGQKAFLILLFQDIAAIGLLALIPIFAGHHSPNHGVGYFAAIIATFSGLFLFSRYALRPLFKLIIKSGATELLTAAALFIVLAVICLMNLLELSTTLGAFLTGLLLADSEFRHEIEASIEPFKGLLLGLFFMAVGMGVNLEVLQHNPEFILGGVIILMFVKIACTFLIAYHHQQSVANSLRLSIALAQGGEFAFVIFALATTEQILSSELLVPLTLIVILSMMLTPVLFWILERWIEPRFILQQKNQDNSTQDSEKSAQQAQMLIAGFGRFGQIIARNAYMNHLPFIAIDNNIEQIDFMSQYGGKIYYGDATQSETLTTAGINTARLFILAIDDIEDSMQIARYVRLYHPDVMILARARDRHHVYLLQELGIQHIWRETYHSALAMAENILCLSGIDPAQAKHNIQAFNQYDQELLQRQQGVYADSQQLVETHQCMLLELENLFENDQFIQKHHPITAQTPNHPQQKE